MGELLQRVGRAIQSGKLLEDGRRVLVAVSGGADSMVLLHVLHQLAPERGWNLVVAHFNHQLRGRAADADERFVCKAAARLGLAVHTERGDVKGYAKKHGVSVEMAARELRHQFLCRIAHRHHFGTIALAHHADDQLELLFLRLLRGSGGRAFRGMVAKGLSWKSPKVILVRPLLLERKDALLEYARTEGLAWREDASNRDITMLRNRVRQKLLPEIEKLFGNAALAPMFHTAELVADESGFAEAAARTWLDLSRRGAAGEAFEILHPAVQRQAMRIQLEGLEVNPGFELIEALRLEAEQRVMVQGGWLVWREETGLVKRAKPERLKMQTGRFSVPLQKEGQALYGGVEVRWEICGAPKPYSKPKRQEHREVFDLERVGRWIVLRNWRPGDRFQPIGMKQPVKLQDLFTNARIPASERRSLVVAEAADGTLFWVERLRMAEKFKVTAETSRLLVWEWHLTGDLGRGS